MDFKELESFIEVINLGSFSKAAEKLYLTQPTITNHIQLLEKEISTLLINRSNKELSPTPAGLILYQYAKDMLNLKAKAELTLNDYAKNIEGNLIINASSVPKQYILPHLMKAFIRQYPDVTFSIVNADSKEISKKITSGYIDFGITGAKYTFPSLKYVKLMADELIFIFPPTENYAKLIDAPLTLAHLPTLPLIIREEGSGSLQVFEDALQKQNLSLAQMNVVGRCNDNETIKKLVANGLGIGIISKNIIQENLERGQFLWAKIETLPLHRSFYFVYHKNRHLTPLSDAFKRFVLSNLSTLDVGQNNCLK